MNEAFSNIFENIKQDPQNRWYTQQGIEPLYTAGHNARILVIGQAPGRIAQQTRTPWNDRSGERLRSWMGISYEDFYNPQKVALLPMDFYFPGSGKSGDLAPREGFAQKWHPQLRALMPHIQLTMLIGKYALSHYLGLPKSLRITEVVREYEHYAPDYIPLVHPSPRNQIWLKKNPWFEKEVIPQLQNRVAQILTTEPSCQTNG
ncbi:MAG: uracil-DNA glycosylase family protein [Atopobium sp.]|uniref:uracil-DNA glycosylase family protein n=1 Tax=Atopobium sp. TaxID=1872650 RepID=UPI002A7649F5|nr:uracil-DNA glycosylase family protein [Atopobium sp.]MDY2788618.1 uracil-DNA glycosylase family protein [Atopobium sp.]